MFLVTTAFVGRKMFTKKDFIGEHTKETVGNLSGLGFKRDDITDLLEGFPLEVTNKTYQLER